MNEEERTGRIDFRRGRPEQSASCINCRTKSVLEGGVGLWPVSTDSAHQVIKV